MPSERALLIVRHAPAEDRSPDGDAGRALTAEGRTEMAQAAHGLARMLDGLDLIATSPLVRARQTADLIAAGFPNAERCLLPELAPGVDRDAFATWLDALTVRRVAVVGHEPDLSLLIGWLIGGRARVRMRKGAAALVALAGAAGQGSAELEWLLTRAALRRIGAPR